MSTPHNNANIGDIAETVLMPGDPLRAKYIADNFLENPVLFNDVRNMYGYTGTYKGKRISVMGSGMGMPSIGIYSFELFAQYDVKNIIRVGSAGSYVADLKILDTMLATSAWGKSTYALECSGDESDVQLPSDELNAKLIAAAKDLGIDLKQGRVHSDDIFYHANGHETYPFAMEHDCVAIEMESFALFHNAKVLGKNAACVLTITDSYVTDERVPADLRRTSLNNMIKIALEAAIKD